MRGHPRGSIQISAPLYGATDGRWRLALVATCLALLALCGFSSTAFAVETHAVQSSFDASGSTAGAFTGLGRIAIDQTSGDVYALDYGHGVIDKFDSEGNPENFAALGASSLEVSTVCTGSPTQAIAVDNSGGPNDGNIYVGNPICAFDSEGNFLWQSPENATGLAVDGSGHLWSSEFGGAYEFESTGSPPAVENILGNGAYPQGLAIDPLGNFYFTDYYFPRVSRYTLHGGFEYEVLHYDPNLPGSLPVVAVDPSTDHLYFSGRPIGFREYGVNGTELIGDYGEEDLNDVVGLAVSGTTHEVYVADPVANRVLIFSALKDLPVATTGAAEDLQRHGATLTGHIDPDGAGSITNCHIEYGLTVNYGNSVPCDVSTPLSGPADVSAEVSGLTGSTQYHFRVFAANASGSNRGKDQTFTTAFVSGVHANPATNLDRTSATLNGSLDPEGIATSYYFQWGLTIGYGQVAPVPAPGEPIGSPSGDTPVSAGITGLESDTTYHFRLVGVNSDGKTAGQDLTFTTLPPIKDLSTESPIEVGPDSAGLSGALDPDGFDTHYYFEWGHTSSYGNVTPSEDAGATTGTKTVSAEIAGLDDYTKYHYRLIATNSFGTTIGEDIEFLSAPPFMPVIGQTVTDSVTNTTATVSANVNPGFGPTVYRFQYGIDVPYSSRTTLSEPIGDDGVDHAVTVTFSNLQPATIYHFRAVATNFSGSTGGTDVTFVTAAPPGIDLTTVSDVAQTSAKLHARIAPNSSPTTFHFDYGPGPGYGFSTPESGSIGADSLGHSVASDLASLAPGTAYHFRVVATNAYGTVAGPDQTFVTTGSSGGEQPKSSECKPGFTRRHGHCVKVHKHRKRHHHRHGGRRNA